MPIPPPEVVRDVGATTAAVESGIGFPGAVGRQDNGHSVKIWTSPPPVSRLRSYPVRGSGSDDRARRRRRCRRSGGGRTKAGAGSDGNKRHHPYN